MKYYHLSIFTNAETYHKVSDILQLTPLEERESHLYEKFGVWTYSVSESEEEDGPYFDFINTFLDVLDLHFVSLEELGINKTDIQFWYLYEYEHQCWMEFHPQQMSRLGLSGINLNIDCWEKKAGR